MKDAPQSDDEIIAEGNRLYKYRMIVGGGTLMALCALLIVAILANQHEIFRSVASAERISGIFLRYFPGLVMAAVIVILWRFYPPAVMRSPSIARKHIDTNHARWQIWTIFMLVAGVYFAFRMNRQHDLFSIAVSFVWMASLAVTICFGPSLGNKKYVEDELIQNLRLRATRVSYLGVIVLLGAACMFAPSKPTLVLSLLPWLLFASVAIPAICYLLLDWRAGRGA